MAPLLCLISHAWAYSRLNVTYSFPGNDRSYRLRECVRCAEKQVYVHGMDGWTSVEMLSADRHFMVIMDLRKSGVWTDLLRPADAPEGELLRPL